MGGGIVGCEVMYGMGDDGLGMGWDVRSDGL